MVDDLVPLKWGVEKRLEFIEFRLFWEGGVNRADIIDMFDVSVPQASKDLSLYQERAPNNAIYDKRAKRYVASASFEPHFLKRDPEGYLSRLRSLAEGLVEPLDSWISRRPDLDVAVTPYRDVDPELLRTVLRALRENRSVEVHYQSMSKDRPDPTWRRITPHAFGHDGFRWHVRALCHVSDSFKDFLLPRMLGAKDMGEAKGGALQDRLWQDHFDVHIGPHPDLSASQQEIVAKDFGMKGGSKILSVRYAMLFYTLKRLGLLDNPEALPARSQHIVVVNAAATKQALTKANFSL